MKKLNLLTVLIMLAFASVSFAQITGTAHDFSGANWNSSGEICITCHTPHNADITVADAPLWNHEVTAASFTMYTSATFDANTVAQPDGDSKLCLSCHDGTVAVDNFSGTTTGTYKITNSKDLGITLMDDHPVSFEYDDALAGTDGGLYLPSSHLSGMGGTIAGDMLVGSKMQCSSCHDVHGVVNVSSLLVKSNAASALCLTCHNK